MVFLRHIRTKVGEKILGRAVRIRAQEWNYREYQLLLWKTINGTKRQLLALVISFPLPLTWDKQVHKSIEHAKKQ